MTKPADSEEPTGFADPPATTTDTGGEGAQPRPRDASLQPEPAAVAPLWTITDGCVIDGMPDEVYHADPLRPGDRSLSHSGLRVVLDVPARFQYQRTHGRKHKRAFDVGHAAHAEVLGTGLDVEVIDAPNYNTKAAQQARDAARAAGRVPLLAWEMRNVRGMAETLRRHPVAGQLFQPGRGVTERSMFWRDPRWGFWRRARTDWAVTLPDGRLALVDYKSTTSAAPYPIAKSAFDYGYYTQDVYYRQAALDCGLVDDLRDVVFLFVFQEKDPPHLVTVGEIDDDGRAAGAAMVAAGLELYGRCLELDQWPDYAPDVLPLALPKYSEYEIDRQWSKARGILAHLDTAATTNGVHS